MKSQTKVNTLSDGSQTFDIVAKDADGHHVTFCCETDLDAACLSRALKNYCTGMAVDPQKSF